MWTKKEWFLSQVDFKPRKLYLNVWSCLLFTAWQVLSSVVLLSKSEHTPCGDGGDEESVQKASKPGTGDHCPLEFEGSRYHDGVGPAGSSITGECALHGGRMSDGNTGNRGHRLHHQGVPQLCSAHSKHRREAEQTKWVSHCCTDVFATCGFVLRIWEREKNVE